MLKKAGIIAGAVAGLLMLGGPAFAAPICDTDHHGRSIHNNSNGISLLNDNNIQIGINPCLNGDQVAVGLVAVAAGLLNTTPTVGSCNNTFIANQ